MTEPEAKSARSRGGRPRLPEKERRTYRRFLVATNEAECARIEELAEAAGMKPTAFLRESAIKRTISWRVNAAARRELRRIGVNLNQLTRVANTTGRVEAVEKLNAVIGELRAVLAEL